jgi:hypothetical protein
VIPHRLRRCDWLPLRINELRLTKMLRWRRVVGSRERMWLLRQGGLQLLLLLLFAHLQVLFRLLFQFPPVRCARWLWLLLDSPASLLLGAAARVQPRVAEAHARLPGPHRRRRG